MQKLEDEYGRSFGMLRVSLTNACNFGCTYCVVPQEKTVSKSLQQPLPYTQLAHIVSTLLSTCTISKIRITGGEPTLYHDLIPFIKLLKEMKAPTLSMTTNGYLLEQKVEALCQAGLEEINVSLDTLNEDTFFRISGKRNLARILKGIDKARSFGMRIKLNTVVMKGLNETEIIPLLNFARDKKIPIRFLELMKMGHLYSSQFENYFYPQDKILEAISENYFFTEQGRATSATTIDYTMLDGYRFGIIANESTPFCSDCNRLRLDSYGRIFGCLSENKSEHIANDYQDEVLLRKKLLAALEHKQVLKFKGSELSMIEIGG